MAQRGVELPANEQNEQKSLLDKRATADIESRGIEPVKFG
jgi:hypothetical protein